MFIISRHITLIVWGVPWGRKNSPFFLHMGLGELLGGYAPGHPNQKGLSRFSHPESEYKNETSVKKQQLRIKRKYINIKELLISRHITLIVWGVPWGRKIPPSSSLWAGGSLWDPAPGHPHQKGLSRFSHPAIIDPKKYQKNLKIKQKINDL